MTLQTTQTPIMERLKAETRGAHDRTEAIPFSAAMVQEQLPIDRFVGQLRAYLPVHRELESLLSSSRHPAIQKVWSDDLRKTPLLEKDLRYFESTGQQGAVDADSAAQSMVAWLKELQVSNEAALLGVLYVLEGSTLGGMVLKPRIAAAYKLCDDQGQAYYSPYGPRAMPHWKEFKERMNAAVVDERDQAAVLDAAEKTFDHIGMILRALSTDL